MWRYKRRIKGVQVSSLYRSFESLECMKSPPKAFGINNLGEGEFQMKLSKELGTGMSRRKFVQNAAIKGAAAF